MAVMTMKMTKNTPRKWIASAIVIFMMFIAPKFAPYGGSLTDLGSDVLCIYIGMAIGWLAVDLAWPSVLGIVALGMTSYSSMNNAIMSCFGNNSAILALFVYVITGVVDKAGVSRWIAMNIAGWKIGYRRPWVLTSCILLSIMTLTLFIGVTPGSLIVWAIFYGICEVYGVKPGDHWATMVMVAIPFFGSVTASIFPFKSLPIVALGAYSAISGGQTIDFPPYFAWMVIVNACIFVLTLLAMRFVIRPDVSMLKNAELAFEKEDLKLNTYQKIVLAWFGLFVLAMMVPTLLPKAWAFTAFFKTLGNTGIAIVFVAAFFLINFTQNQSMREVVSKSVRFDAFFVNCAAIGIAAALSSDSTGISQWFVDITAPITEGKSPLVITMILVASGLVMTQFLNNLGACAIFVPVAFSIAVASGVNPQMVCMCLICAFNFGILTPSACNPAALLYSNGVWVKGLRPHAYAAVYMLCAFLILMLIGVPISGFFFPPTI